MISLSLAFARFCFYFFFFCVMLCPVVILFFYPLYFTFFVISSTMLYHSGWPGVQVNLSCPWVMSFFQKKTLKENQQNEHVKYWGKCQKLYYVIQICTDERALAILDFGAFQSVGSRWRCKQGDEIGVIQIVRSLKFKTFRPPSPLFAFYKGKFSS